MKDLGGETKRGFEYLKEIFESGKILRVGELEELRGDRNYFRIPISGFLKRWELCLTRENLDDLPGTSEHRDAAMVLAEILKSRLRNSDPHLYLTAAGSLLRILPVWPYSMLMGEVDHGVIVHIEDLQKKQKEKWFVISRSAPYEYWSNPYRRHEDIVNTVRRAFDSGQMGPVLDASGDATTPKPISVDVFVQAKVWMLGHLAGATPKSAVWITDPWDADYFSISKEEMARRAAVLDAQRKIELLEDENDFARVGHVMLAQDGPDRWDPPARADESREVLDVHGPRGSQPGVELPERAAGVEDLSSAKAFRPLKSFFPTADELLQQDLPTLGKVLLAHLSSYKGQNTVYQYAGLNRGYFRAMLENRSIGLGTLPKEPEYQARQPEVTKRMMEAWNWLERQGLLIHNDEQAADWFTISSDGEKYLDQDKAPNPLLQPSSVLLAHNGAGREFDVFISHSSVDNPYVAPLVSALEAAGISVWFDKITMEWGDSLRSEIDRGLAACRYGIVVFSKAFLKKKKWTEHELNALFAREEPGKKVILPIWHGITRDDLIEYSPAFADRLAKNSVTDSYADIVEGLLSMLGGQDLVSSRASAESLKSPHLAAPVANAIVVARNDAKEPTPPAVTGARPQESPTHNVVFLSAAFVKIAYSGPGYSPRTDGMHSFSEVEGASKGGMIGLVARFRNEAIYGQEVTAARAVRAHLKLFDRNGREIGTGYSSALWLGHPSDTFDLLPNGRGGSVLVCWGSNTEAHVSWKTRVAIDRLRDNDIELRDGYPSRAEVALMDSNHRPLLKPIVLEITKTAGELSVVARQ